MRTLYSKLNGKRNLCDDVRTHLEGLLNSKAYYRHNSIIAYGIPDFSQMITDSHYTKSELVGQISRAIKLYEPRLESVLVEILNSEKDDELALIIAATIRDHNTTLDVRFSSNVKHGLEKLSLNGDYHEPETLGLLSV